MTAVNEDRPWEYDDGVDTRSTKFFTVEPIEDNVAGGRRYFHARSKNHSEYPMITDPSEDRFNNTGTEPFEFDKSYFLEDLEGHREEVQIAKLPLKYRVRYRSA